MQSMRFHTLLAFLTISAAAAFAADATGTWTGELTSPTGERMSGALVILQHQGTKLTGTAGPDDGEQRPLENGSATDTGDIQFEINTGNSVMKFKLKLEGDEIKGDVTREREGQQQSAKLALKRKKTASTMPNGVGPVN